MNTARPVSAPRWLRLIWRSVIVRFFTIFTICGSAVGWVTDLVADYSNYQICFHLKSISDRPLCIGEEAYNIVFEKWIKQHNEFAQTKGAPNLENEAIPILWYQFFRKGVVLYIPGESAYVIAHEKGDMWTKYELPRQLISLYPKVPSDIDEVYLASLHSGERYDDYLALHRDFLLGNIGLTGGIGTLYVENDLGPELGEPIERELHTYHAGLNEASQYKMIIGAPNQKGKNCNPVIRAVYILINHNTEVTKGIYHKHVINVGNRTLSIGKC